MPPKKPTGKVANAPVIGKPAESSGLYIPSSLPPWDDGDIDREDWGDLTLVVTAQTPATAFYVDGHPPDAPGPAPSPVVSYLQHHVKEWKRPSAIFSPFKPVVVRPWTPVTEGMESGEYPAENQKYNPARAMRTFKNEEHFETLGVTAESAESPKESGTTRTKRRPRRDRGQFETPPLMRSFNSALMILQQYEAQLPKGYYAWEMIYPQTNGVPVFNPSGKYVVKLFWNGAFFKVVIDDRLPTDIYGQSMYTVTESKEIWPALLAKAILKVLGPTHEHLLFTSPMITLGCILPGWVPQYLSPLSHELDLLPVLLEYEKSNGATTLLIGITTPSETAPTTAYAVTGVQRNAEACMILAVTTHVAPEADGAVITGVDKIHSSWRTVQIPWAAMKTAFTNIVVLRPTTATASNPKPHFIESKQIYHAPPDVLGGEHTAPAHPAPGGKDAKEPPPPSTPLHVPINHTKWAVVKNPSADTDIMVVHSAVHLPGEQSYTPMMTHPPPAQCTITVQLYNWKQRPCYRTLLALKTPATTTTSATLRLPKGVSALRIDVEGLIPTKAAFTMMFSCPEVSWGEEREILQGALQLNRWGDAGQYNIHEPGMPTVWFKRHLLVKGTTPAECCISVGSLPKGTDIEPYKTALPVVETKGKGPAAEKGKPGGKAAPAQAVPQHPVVDDSHIPEPPVDIMSHSELILVDLESNNVTRTRDGKLMNVMLNANKAGYMLMASAITPCAYPRGLWVTYITSDTPFERIEPKPFDEVVTKTGEYKINQSGTLFKYYITAAEAATASVIVSVSESLGAAFTVTVTQNDKPILTRTDVHSLCMLEHIPLAPPEKGANSVYAVQCTLDAVTVSTLRHMRSEKVKEMFAMREAVTGHVHTAEVKFAMRVLASSQKLDVREDTSAQENVALVKASWARPKDAAAENTQKSSKPAKDKSAAITDDNVRSIKAKEARAKYLAKLCGHQVEPHASASELSASMSVSPAPGAGGPTPSPTRFSLPQASIPAAELQSKIDALVDNVNADFKQFVLKSRSASEEQLIAVQKGMEASVAAWIQRRKEGAPTDDEAGGKGKGKKK